MNKRETLSKRFCMHYILSSGKRNCRSWYKIWLRPTDSGHFDSFCFSIRRKHFSQQRLKAFTSTKEFFWEISPTQESLVKETRIRTGEEPPRNKKHTRKGTGVGHGVHEELKESPCGQSKGQGWGWRGDRGSRTPETMTTLIFLLKATEFHWGILSEKVVGTEVCF